MWTLKPLKTLDYLSIFFLWVLSVIFVFNDKTQPMGKRHQDLLAHQLITYELWDKNGFFYYKGGLILTYPNAGDLGIKADPIMNLSNHRGEHFYVSYPPFHFYLTYLIIKVFHLPIHEQTLKSIASLFLLVNMLLLGKLIGEMCFLPLALYVSLPNVLWFHHNNWFLDFSLITWALMSLYFARKNAFFFLLSGFMAAFTEWWGLLINITLLGLAILASIGIIPSSHCIPYLSKALNRSLFGIIAIILPIVLMIMIFSMLGSCQSLLKALAFRWVTRAGIVQPAEGFFFYFYHPQTLIFIAWYYARNYVSLIFLIFLAVLFQTERNWFMKLSIEIWAWILAVIIHHGLLLNWTAAHDFSVLKTAPWFVLLFAILWQGLQGKKRLIVQGLAFIVIIFQLQRYVYHTNQVPYRYEYKEIAKCIREEYKLDEVARANYYNLPLPYLWYEAKRNVIRDSTAKCGLK